MRELNRSVFHWINQWPEGLAPVMKFFSEATNYLGVKVVLLVLVAAMLGMGRLTRKTIVQTLIAVGVANEATDLWKGLMRMPRPFQELPDVVMRAGWSESAGTASAHSANMAAVALVFCYHLKWWGAPWVAIAFLTGLSRIYVGVHYPSQVLLGWATGLLGALLVIKIWELFLRRFRPNQAAGTDASSAIEPGEGVVE